MIEVTGCLVKHSQGTGFKKILTLLKVNYLLKKCQALPSIIYEYYLVSKRLMFGVMMIFNFNVILMEF